MSWDPPRPEQYAEIMQRQKLRLAQEDDRRSEMESMVIWLIGIVTVWLVWRRRRFMLHSLPGIAIGLTLSALTNRALEYHALNGLASILMFFGSWRAWLQFFPMQKQKAKTESVDKPADAA